MSVKAVFAILVCFLVLPRVVYGQCAAPSRAAELSDTLHDAEYAYGKLDVEKFNQSVEGVGILLPCLADGLGPELAADYHRLRGLQLFVRRDRDGAVLSFAAAKALEPDFSFSELIVPLGHTVREVYAEEVEREVQAVPPVRRGYLTFDGVQTMERPTSWPTVVQVHKRSGEVVSTTYVLPTAAMPPYEQPSGARLRVQIAMFSLAGATAIAGTVVYGLAIGSEKDFKTIPPDRTVNEADLNEHWDELDARRRASNRKVLASASLGAVALSAAIAGVVVSF